MVNLVYSLFAVTIFLSSFLLFQVQPLLGKHLLPWFGGSSAVWVSVLLFFMVALAVGYVYAMYLTRLKFGYQTLIHICLVIVSLLLLKSHATLWTSAITPDFVSLSLDLSSPVWAVFKTLLISIGLPFILLSSTSSLLQVWYNNFSGKEPFTLYSISNVGSLLGLVSYPIFFERYFYTPTQGEWWTYGFVLYCTLLLMIIYLFLVLNKSVVLQTEKVTIDSSSKKQFFIWMGLALVPVTTMLAGTTFMTSSVASVPFLWVGPLALYLLSFIITFREGKRTAFWFNEILVLITALITIFLIILLSVGVNVFLLIIITHLALFAIYHWCHEYLYALRPKSEHLTTFYVALSIGGIAGSLLVKLSISYFLVIPIELLIILVSSIGFIAYRLFQAQSFYIPFLNQKQTRFISIFVLTLALFSSAFYIDEFERGVVAQERNFFGYKAIKNIETKEGKSLILQHGTTNHGFQVYLNNEPQILPTSYYATSSGVGKAFAHLREQKIDNPNIAIAGLGSGVLLAYCQPQDNFNIFEIDKDMYDLSRKNFTYLDHCPQAEVIISDARLALNQISEKGETVYDLIIIDAYADDVVPIHLLTSEAMALYKKLLAKDGVIAVHVSSRYLDLLPVFPPLASKNELTAGYFYDKHPSVYGSNSLWVLLSKDEQVLNNDIFSELSDFTQITNPVVWTDTYSALFPVIRMNK